MPSPRRRLLIALVVWTTFVWGTRISNAWLSTTESTAAKLSSTVVSLVFLAFAAATVWILVRTRTVVLDRRIAGVLAAFAVWTTGVWAVRIMMIVLADHTVAFKMVHAALGLISVALAFPAWQLGRTRWSAEPVAGYPRQTMGQPVTVIEKQTSRPGVVRYETNRVISGMGHEYFRSLDDAQGDAPADRLARTLLERGGITAVHVSSNVITVHLADGSPPTGIKALVEDMYTYYREGVVPVVPEGAAG